MNLITGTESAELFGRTVSPAVQYLIEVAPSDAIYRQNPRSSRSNQLSTTLLKRRR